MKILITEDSEFDRSYLSLVLTNWDHDVLLASDGCEALDLLQRDSSIQMLITDWVMPNMNGLELCRQVRASPIEHYIYIIMLTGREDLVEGDDYPNDLSAALKIGADTFLKKPVDPEELEARICAGERMLNRDENLAGYNKILCQTNDQLLEAQQNVQKELEYAAQIQKGFLPKLPEANAALKAMKVQFAAHLIPCGVVSGDSFNFFRLDESEIGFYHLDVSGHGVSSAMLSVGLNQMISPNSGLLKSINLGKELTYSLVAPNQVAAALNSNHQCDEENGLYFTMVYGLLNALTGEVTLTQAGHPSPILIQATGARFIGTGGFPVGLIPSAEYEVIKAVMAPGDRLLLYSDGVTECENKTKEPFTESRLLALCQRYARQSAESFLSDLVRELTDWRGSGVFDDDVSMLLLERL